MPSPGSTINISGLTPIDDPEYRYKMPVVFGKIEGRGNGIKTVIPNITDVAFSLHRQPGEVNKFFGCELGAQTTYAVEAERAVVNGAHTDAVLQQMIHRYVEEFVLCPSCGLPETEYKIKNDTIWHRCAACGANEMVNMEHKLCTYILAQDKKRRQDEKKLEKGKKAEKKDRKTNDKATSKEKNGEGNEGSEKAKSKEHKKPKKKADSDSGGDEEKKKKKKEKRDKEKKKKHGSNGHHHHGDKNHLGDVDDLSVEEAGVDDSGAMDLAVDATKKFLKENPNASVSEIADLVINQQMASALKSHDRILILLRAAISPDFFKKKEIALHAPVISKLTGCTPIMERHLIAAAEGICAEKPKLFPVMIKQLYDVDALDEDVILEWAGEGRNEYTLDEVDEDTRAVMRGEAEPVVVWLQEADSDESSAN